MGDAERPVLQAPTKPLEERQREVVADVAWCVTQVGLTRRHAEDAGNSPAVRGELGELEERLKMLHLVVLVEAGWCPRCSAALTEPGRSPSGARHCRRCRVGWILVKDQGRLRAIDRAWPDPTGATTAAGSAGTAAGAAGRLAAERRQPPPPSVAKSAPRRRRP